MKRLVSLLMVFAMMMISAAWAEPIGFSVRGGISFNSTKEDIIAFEKSEGNEVLANPENTTTKEYYSDNCLVCKHISFAGYDDAYVVYYFDDDEKLVSIIFVVYQVEEENGKKMILDIYNRLNQSLESKYGTSLGADDAITLAKSDKAYGTIEWLKSFGVLGEYIDFEQRIVEIENGYAEIQIMAARVADFEARSVPYSVAVSYAHIDESVVQGMLDIAEQAEHDLDADL